MIALKLGCLFFAILFGFVNVSIVLAMLLGKRTKALPAINNILMSAGIVGFIYLQWLNQ